MYTVWIGSFACVVMVCALSPKGCKPQIPSHSLLYDGLSIEHPVSKGQNDAMIAEPKRMRRIPQEEA
ncbi:hypothetical protein VNO77_20480 [Canavalia gladiata]|uniref:Secreted protein n=1 Tax=Canavalia gladiata TaxID=3824 RepID=A0AAN9LPA9_CANGL